MDKFAILDQLLENGRGYLKTATVLENNISKTTLKKYVEFHNLERVAHGIYMSEDAWPDDYYLLQARNSRVIFSYESALYLHGLMEREPSQTTVTVPRGYNSSHIKSQGIRVIHSKPDWYNVGVISIETNFGNEIMVYDKERTICDIIRAKKEMEIQTFQTALREYMDGKDKNLGNLMKYANTFGIESLVRTYTEVML